MHDLKESDWTLFKKIKERALEQYCESILDETKSTIDDTAISSHERYLSLYSLVAERNKRLAQLFDGHSRSKASIQLLLIRCEGIADPALVAQLSQELKDSTHPDRLK